MKRMKLLVFCLILYTTVKYSSARTVSNQESWFSNLANVEKLPYAGNARFSSQQTETIEVGNRNLPEAVLIKQASDVGMDSVAIAELLRTREPVIITNTDASGRHITTTYKLTDGGGISSRTVTEGHDPSFDVNTRGNFELPSSHSAAPSPAVFTNSAGPRKVENDWEWASVPKTNTPPYAISGRGPFSFGSPFGSDVNDDDFFKLQSGPRPAHGSTATTFGEVPDSWRNRDWLHKPGFELLPGAKPKVTTTTEIDDQGRKITTTKTVYSTLPHDQWPDSLSPSLFGNEDKGDGPKTTTQPSLKDFHKSQNGGNEKFDRFPFTTTPRTVYINIDELPTTSTTATKTTTKKVKSEIKPLIEDFWLQEPYVTTTTKVNNFEPAEEEEENPVPSSQSGTKVSTLSKTVTSNGLPALADLDSSMQEILNQAGITDEDLRNSNGQTITKTRVAPDGRVIKTTYNAQSLPQGSTFENREVLQKPQTFTVRRQHDLQLPSLDANADRSFSHKQDRATFPESTNSVPNNNHDSIDRFLANVNLSPEDFSSKQGEVTKTLIDDSGRVLTATFVLSTVKGARENERENTAKELDPVK